MVTKSEKEISVQDLAEQLGTVQSDVAELTDLIRKLSVQKAGNVADDVMDTVSRVTSMGKMSVDEARRRGEALASDVEDSIARNPLTSVLIAVGLGFVLGSLAGRR